MFEMWLLMCLMVSDGNMGMKQECTEYKEKPMCCIGLKNNVCLRNTEKISNPMRGMFNLGADYKSLKAGCKKVNDETKH